MTGQQPRAFGRSLGLFAVWVVIGFAVSYAALYFVLIPLLVLGLLWAYSSLPTVGPRRSPEILGLAFGVGLFLARAGTVLEGAGTPALVAGGAALVVGSGALYAVAAGTRRGRQA